jgi:hypothetical protein
MMKIIELSMIEGYDEFERRIIDDAPVWLMVDKIVMVFKADAGAHIYLSCSIPIGDLSVRSIVVRERPVHIASMINSPFPMKSRHD